MNLIIGGILVYFGAVLFVAGFIAAGNASGDHGLQPNATDIMADFWGAAWDGAAEAPWRLSAEPEAKPLPAYLTATDRAERRRAILRALLDRPRWTDRDYQRASRISGIHSTRTYDIIETAKAWEPANADEDWELLAEVDSATAEWERLANSPPLPTTAQLRRQFVHGSRADRGLRIYDRIAAARDERTKKLRSTMKVFKTWEASRKQEIRVFGSDPVMTRLDKALRNLERVVPDLSNLRWNRDSQRRGRWS